MHARQGDPQGHEGDLKGHEGDLQGHEGDPQGHECDVQGLRIGLIVGAPVRAIFVTKRTMTRTYTASPQNEDHHIAIFVLLRIITLRHLPKSAIVSDNYIGRRLVHHCTRV